MKATRLKKVLSEIIEERWAVFLWGAPGVGKSSLVREVASEKNLPVIDIRASLLDPTDLRGLPMVKDGKALWCPPVFLPSPKDKPGILFLDEINAAPPLVQAGLYQLVLDHRVGEYELPDGWRIVAAGNRREDEAVTFRLSSALVNRFVHLTLEADLEDWQSWALEHDITPVVRAFLRYRPAMLSHKDEGSEVFASPRSWEMLSDMVKRLGSVEALEDFASGIVGQGASIEFLHFAKNTEVRALVDAIIENPLSAPLPKNLSDLWMLVSLIAAQAKESNIREACAALLTRLPADFSIVLSRDVLKIYPGFAKNKQFLSFMASHAAFFKKD